MKAVRFAVCLACALGVARGQGMPRSGNGTFSSHGHQVAYETFPSAGPSDPLLILVAGTSGPDAPQYQSQAKFFASHGYTTLLLHFFDAASSRTPSDATYGAWADSLADLVYLCKSSSGYQGRPVYVVGFSLGASIALAAGSQKLDVAAIAEWYGSLPDSFFYKLQGMPPLLILHGQQDTNIPVMNAQQLMQLCQMKDFDCAHHLYPNQGHGFVDAALADAHQRTLDFFHAHPGGGSAQGTTPAGTPNP